MGISGTKVHRGFYDIAINAIDKLENLLHTKKHIVITGHSLGGGVGMLVGSILFVKGNKNVEVITFGSPAVGNDLYLHTIKGLKHTRYTHIYDIIGKLNKKVAQKIIAVLRRYIRKYNNVWLRSVYFLLSSINYDYVYDKCKTIYLKNRATTPQKYKNLPYVLRVALTPLKYHSINTYKEGVEKL